MLAVKVDNIAKIDKDWKKWIFQKRAISISRSPYRHPYIRIWFLWQYIFGKSIYYLVVDCLMSKKVSQFFYIIPLTFLLPLKAQRDQKQVEMYASNYLLFDITSRKSKDWGPNLLPLFFSFSQIFQPVPSFDSSRDIGLQILVTKGFPIKNGMGFSNYYWA